MEALRDVCFGRQCNPTPVRPVARAAAIAHRALGIATVAVRNPDYRDPRGPHPSRTRTSYSSTLDKITVELTALSWPNTANATGAGYAPGCQWRVDGSRRHLRRRIECGSRVQFGHRFEQHVGRLHHQRLWFRQRTDRLRSVAADVLSRLSVGCQRRNLEPQRLRDELHQLHRHLVHGFGTRRGQHPGHDVRQRGHDIRLFQRRYGL